MKIYILDEDYETLKTFENIFSYNFPKYKVMYFTNTERLTEQVKKSKPNVIIADVQASNALFAMKKISNENKKLNIIFTSSNGDFIETAFDLCVSGYIVKPIDEEKVKKQMNNLRHPVIRKIGEIFS